MAANIVPATSGKLSISDMKGVFAQCDKDKDGNLNLDELKSCLSSTGTPADVAKKFIDAYDRDKNALISWMEFLTAVLVKNMKAPSKVDLLEGLAKLPRDKSGDKDLDEMVVLMKFHGHDIKPPQIQTWLKNSKKN